MQIGNKLMIVNKRKYNLVLGGMGSIITDVNKFLPYTNCILSNIKDFFIKNNDVYILNTKYNFSFISFLGNSLTYIYENENLKNIGQEFANCTNLQNVELTQVTYGVNGLFNNCINLSAGNIKLPLLIEIFNGTNCFRGIKADNSTLYLPKLTKFSGSYAMRYSTYNVDFPNLRETTYHTVFRENSGNFINIPKCIKLGDSVGDDQHFYGNKIGQIINIDRFMQTCNAGSLEGDLLYAKNTRGAIINFIDN